MPEVSIEASEIVQRKADDRGRVRLGPEYAEADVEVAVVAVDGAKDGEQSAK